MEEATLKLNAIDSGWGMPLWDVPWIWHRFMDLTDLVLSGEIARGPISTLAFCQPKDINTHDLLVYLSFPSANGPISRIDNICAVLCRA